MKLATMNPADARRGDCENCYETRSMKEMLIVTEEEDANDLRVRVGAQVCVYCVPSFEIPLKAEEGAQ